MKICENCGAALTAHFIGPHDPGICPINDSSAMLRYWACDDDDDKTPEELRREAGVEC